LSTQPLYRSNCSLRLTSRISDKRVANLKISVLNDGKPSEEHQLPQNTTRTLSIPEPNTNSSFNLNFRSFKASYPLSKLIAKGHQIFPTMDWKLEQRNQVNKNEKNWGRYYASHLQGEHPLPPHFDSNSSISEKTNVITKTTRLEHSSELVNFKSLSCQLLTDPIPQIQDPSRPRHYTIKIGPIPELGCPFNLKLKQPVSVQIIKFSIFTVDATETPSKKTVIYKYDPQFSEAFDHQKSFSLFEDVFFKAKIGSDFKKTIHLKNLFESQHDAEIPLTSDRIKQIEVNLNLENRGGDAISKLFDIKISFNQPEKAHSIPELPHRITYSEKNVHNFRKNKRGEKLLVSASSTTERFSEYNNPYYSSNRKTKAPLSSFNEAKPNKKIQRKEVQEFSVSSSKRDKGSDLSESDDEDSAITTFSDESSDLSARSKEVMSTFPAYNSESHDEDSAITTFSDESSDFSARSIAVKSIFPAYTENNFETIFAMLDPNKLTDSSIE
jgi:hypothetical protein